MTSNMQRKKDVLERELSSIRSSIQSLDGKRKAAKEFAMMMVNPGDETVVHAPALFPARGATRHFRRVFTMQAPAAGSKFSLKVRPGIRDFISIKTSEAVTALTTIGVNIDFHDKAQQSAELSVYTTIGGVANSLLAEGFLKPSIQGFVDYFWTSTNTGTLDAFRLFNQWSEVVKCTVRAYNTIGGSADFSFSLSPGETLDVVGTVTTGVNTWLGFGIKGPINAYVLDNSATATTLVNPVTQNFSKEELLAQGQIERYRITAMSVLCSYRGNLLENAGVIAAARAPDAWAPDASDMYTSLGKLVDDSYRGPLINGAYVWWLPGDLQELDYTSPGEKLGSAFRTALYVGGEFTDAGGALEVTVELIAEFYSPLQIFERELFPPLTDEYLEMFHEMSKLPAATCNPSHLDILKRGVKNIAKMGLAGYRYAQAHPEYVQLLIKGLSALAV